MAMLLPDVFKNFFSSITGDYKFFDHEENGYRWHNSRVDGMTYTCIRKENLVRIFLGTVHYNYFDKNYPLAEFEVTDKIY